jgi:soluble lytic murein transglycosylase
MRNEARAELNSLADQYRNDPIIQYQLGRLWLDLGLYDMVIRSGSRILALAPVTGMSQAPAYAQRMMYPAPFADLVVSQAQKNGVDPLLLYAILWQESQFDPAAISTAGAMGLGQVMPGTGSDIAARLKKAGYKSSDLLKPYVSIEFGAYYFGFQFQYFAKDYLMALAGYNGGPGNAAKWDDPDADVAVENISLSETRTYVRRIYLHYWHYRDLYGDEAQIN